MPDEPREIHPFIMHDKMVDNKLDFRPKPVYTTQEEQVPDPKDSSVQVPAVSSDTVQTIEPKPEKTVSVAKASTNLKANANGKPTSSDQILTG